MVDTCDHQGIFIEYRGLNLCSHGQQRHLKCIFTVEVNEWAQFNCTVRCHYTVGWYMAGHSIAIRKNNTVPGLLIKRPRVSKCTQSDKRTHFLEVLATEAFNKSTFYCGAYERRRVSCSCGTGGRCYSRPALLTGKPIWNTFL